MRFSGTLMSGLKSLKVVGEYEQRDQNGIGSWDGWVKGKEGAAIPIGEGILTLSDGKTARILVDHIHASSATEPESHFVGNGPPPH